MKNLKKILRQLSSRPDIIGFSVTLIRFTRTLGPFGGLRHAWNSHGFDIWFGVDTLHVSKKSNFWGEGVKSKTKINATDSTSDNVYRVKKALDNIGNHLDFNQTVFVDLGCGKGRTMMIASRYPFYKIIGVELSYNIANICKNNIQKKKLQCTLIQGSMTDVDWRSHLCDSKGLLIYAFNPTSADVLTKTILNILSESRDREIYFIYTNPQKHFVKEKGYKFEILSKYHSQEIYKIYKV